MKDFGGQVPSLPKLRDVLLCDRRGHPPALKAGSGHGWRFGALGLSLGYWNSRWGKGRIKRGEKRTDLDLFIKGMDVKHPPRGRLELA